MGFLPYLSPQRGNLGIVDAVKGLFQIRGHDHKTLDSLLQIDKRCFDDSQQGVKPFNLAPRKTEDINVHLNMETTLSNEWSNFQLSV